MSSHDRAHWALHSLIALALLLAPAIWNRFPLVEYDTGGYLARWWEGYLVPSRSTVYGLFLAAGWPLDFWPVVAIQAALTVWILALSLRAFGFGGRPRLLLAVTAALALLTTLPFLAGILLTDIFAGTALLALHILVFRNGTLARAERAALILFTAFCAATHSATFAVLLGLLIAGGCAWIFWRDLVPLAGLARGLGALALGAVMLLGANFGLSGRLAWTPGGYGIVFARMLQDGVIKRYLDDHCPDSTLKLCPYRDKLPATADQFLWGESFFDDLGRFDGLGDEMRRIVLESLIAYPKMQIETALADAAEQLVAVASGEGVGTDVYHSYGMMEMYTPAVLPALWAARQQKGELDFAAINHLHVPVALISMVLLPVIVIVALRRRGPADIGLLAGTVGLALLGNAVVCGVLSNPHDRYGARLAWTATFVVVLIVLRLARPHPERAPGRNTHGVRA